MEWNSYRVRCRDVPSRKDVHPRDLERLLWVAADLMTSIRLSYLIWLRMSHAYWKCEVWRLQPTSSSRLIPGKNILEVYV